MKYPIYYVKGLDPHILPKKTAINIKKSGITIFNLTITWNEVTKVQVRSDIVQQNMSIGKAIAGDIVAGGVGALVGGMKGKTGSNNYIQIKYHRNEQLNQIIFIAKGQTKVQEKMIKKLFEYSENPPAPHLHRDNYLSLNHARDNLLKSKNLVKKLGKNSRILKK